MTNLSRGIAIVGLSGRYPGGADTPAHLWANLKSGLDAVGEARGDRWDAGYHHPDPDRPGRVYTRAGAFLDQIDGFDAEFFGLSPREARQVDPQQRLLLELAWEALEDAAIAPSRVAGSDAGVFIGISSHDYASLTATEGPDAYSNTGSAFSIAANRISYILDIHGPSVAVDTACSSSLVCVHQACMHLLAGDCSIALAGGVNILINIQPWIGFAKASMLSPTGRCHSFDAKGDGFVRAEGGGLVVLKPLAAAERDGDSIYGVILASGVNSDGRTLGLAMPSVDAQEQLLRKVYSACGVAAEDVVYVEAHGTGTAVGDPIECESIGRVLGAPRTDGTRCLIGSIKSNIGHLEPAAGIAGLTKVLLAFRHHEIPANLHFETPNPRIDFDAWKLGVVSAATPLPEREKALVCGVNSFGFGGTNAHVAVAEYRASQHFQPPRSSSEWQQVLLLSAHSETALRALASRYPDFLREEKNSSWVDICATAALCRSRLRYRLAVSATNADEASVRLKHYLAGEAQPRLATGNSIPEKTPIAFVYSGNGPQWWGMGRELLASSAEFRREVEAIDTIFAPMAGWSLIDEMQCPESEARTALTEVAQPLLFALQLGLTTLLRSAGIRPSVTLGHSVGEIAAAYAAGALSLEQATRVIFHRSLLQAKTAGLGGMAALGISADEAQEAMRSIPGWLELAASNAPRSVTIAGDRAALERLRDDMTTAGKFARVLPLNYAFHTSAMNRIEEQLLESLAGLTPRLSDIPFISTVDAAEKPGPELSAEYWWRNIREPVRFHDAVEHLLEDRGTTVFLEIGPHPVLRDYIQQSAKEKGSGATALATLRRPAANRPEPEADNLWSAICSCHALGASQPESIFERPQPPAALPFYPWQRTKHWRGGVALPNACQPLEREHPLLGSRTPSGDGLWENALDPNLLPYLRDHVVQGVVIFPAAGYIELALAAGRLSLGNGIIDIDNLEILRPLAIPPQSDPLIQFAADAKDGTFEARARVDVNATDWTRHVRGRLSRLDWSRDGERIDLASLRASLPCQVDAQGHYLRAAIRGLAYGPEFQGVRIVWMSNPTADKRAALAEIQLPALEGPALSPYLAHPALLDSCVQALITLIDQNERRSCSIIPIHIGRIRSLAPLPSHVFCHLEVRHESHRSAVADFRITDREGNLLLTLTGTRCQKVDFRQGTASPMLAEWWRPASSHPAPIHLPSPRQTAARIASEVARVTQQCERDVLHRDIRPRFRLPAGEFPGDASQTLYDQIARTALLSLIASWPAGRIIRIVQIAGADGGLTACLLPVLPPERTDYLFTDPSEPSLGKAAQRFSAYPFVRFAAFDIERDPVSPGQPAGNFDLVIAANALNATSDLRAALARVKTLAAPGGQLLTIESHEDWHEALAVEGFGDPVILSSADAVPTDEESLQSVALARVPVTPVAASPRQDFVRRRWLLVAEPDRRLNPFVNRLIEALQTRGQHVTTSASGDVSSAFEDAPAEIVVIADCLAALKVVQTLENSKPEPLPQLTLVTRGALATATGEGPLHLGEAPLWGLGRVIANEHPRLNCRQIDVHAESAESQAAVWLADELLCRDGETEVQLAGGQRFVNRERATSPIDEARFSRRSGAGDPGPFTLDFTPQGGLDSLHLRGIDRRTPAESEVEIRVHAAGLNFRDVLWTMGMLPEEAVENGFSGPTIGMECAGEIISVGAKVEGLKPGDRVMAFSASSFASHVTTDAASVALVPGSLSFEEAATIPTAFLTAWYALDHLARLAPGEVVLVHGAAGGVGLAALQIAKLKGAKVIGTAGSPAKRHVLEMLGVDHALNSRSLDFAEDVMRLTGGSGVDVVLNSLAGEAITKSLEILRPFGRFLEIGKRDLYANSRIGLRPFRNNLSYFGIDADTLLVERPELARSLFQSIAGLFESRALRPLPYQSVPISRASEAFRTMQQSRHIGKIVVSMDADVAAALPVVGSARSVVLPDATYLVTGGLGGFGLATARWLVEQGARSLALIGRRGAASEEALEGIAAMQAAGANVRAFAADVARLDEVERVVAVVHDEMPPLRGVIHAAAVIEDAPILHVTSEQFERVLAPKAAGAWNLHQATLHLNLDMFVLYSSSSAVVGNPGQGSYVAANFYLESLAQYRRARGLPALAIGWGAIKDAGFLTRNNAVAGMLKQRTGLDATPAHEALQDLERLLATGATRVCVARFNLQRLAQLLPGARAPRFLPIVPEGLDPASRSDETLAELLQTAPASERGPLILSRLRHHAGRVLGTGADQIDPERSLAEMGLDSLMAVELAEALERDMGQPVPVMQLLSAGNILAIAGMLVKALGSDLSVEPAPDAVPELKAA